MTTHIGTDAFAKVVQDELGCDADTADAIIDHLTTIVLGHKSVLSVEPHPSIRRPIRWHDFVLEWTLVLDGREVIIGEKETGERALLSIGP